MDPDDQLKLPYTIIDIIPWNHFGRKSIAFMLAIDYGAEIIYDFDDDNHLMLPKLDDIKNYKRTMINTPSHLYNPYPYFMTTDDKQELIPDTWPRGFPLCKIHDTDTFTDVTSFSHDDYSKIKVFQSLADNDPDVDAVFRMTGKGHFSFPRQHEMVIPDQDVFTPWNAQATFFKKEAFFSLMLPITVHGRVSDIWRSYFADKIFWQTDIQMAFVSSFVTQYRNPHDYTIDFKDELPLYRQANQMLTDLGALDIPKSSTVQNAMLKIYKTMADKGYIKHLDVEVMRRWLHDLETLGYEFPKIVRSTNKFKFKGSEIVDQRDLESISTPNSEVIKKIFSVKVKK